jgi:virginiamycin B lyase
VGQVTEFPVAQGFPGTLPGFPGNAMARGSDGNVWFSTNNPVTIGRITPAGQVTQFADPTTGATLAADFTLGSDSNVWFLDMQGQVERIGRVTPAGQISEFLIPAFKGNRVSVNLLTLGSDGNIWFTSNTFVGRGTVSNGFIGRVTTAGQISEFGTPTAVSDPHDIALGSDGNLWFNEAAAHAVGRILTH